MGILKEIPKFLGEMLKALKTIISTILKGLVEPAKKLFSDMWNGIKNIFAPIKDFFKEKFTAAKEAVTNAFANISKWFSDKWNAIKNTFANVGGFFKEKFTQAWTNIKNVFSGFGNFFGNLWNIIKNKFSAIGTKIGDAIGSSVKKGINGVIGSIESVINKGINMINGAIGLINKIPGVNIGLIKKVQFRRLETGGVVKKPTYAQVGENGAEAVVPLEKNTWWINQVVKKMKTAFDGLNNGKTADMNRTVKEEYSFGVLVKAFTKALERVKVELNDDVAGKFVEETVAKAIYGGIA